MFPATLATVLFALSSVSAKRSVHFLGPNNASLARITVAALLLAVYAHGWGGGFSGVGLGWYFISGIIGFGICDTAIFLALPRLGAQLTTLLVQCLAVPIATGTEWLWLGTRLTSGQILAMGVILIGIALALFPERRLTPGPMAWRTGPQVGWFSLGLGVVAAAGQAWGAVLSRHGQQLALAAGESIDGLTVTYQRIVPGVGFTLVWWLILRWHAQIRLRPTHRLPEPELPKGEMGASGDSSLEQESLPPRPGTRPGGEAQEHKELKGFRGAWPWILVNALSGPSLGVGCYQWALAETPTGVVTAITALTPLAVIPLAWWLDGERPTRRSVLGGLIAVVGAIGLRLAGE